MRIKRNLERYYEGLELEQMNKLWSMMWDLEYRVKNLKFYYHNYETRIDNPKRWKEVMSFIKFNLRFDVYRINKYMESLNKESIFEKKEYWTPNDYLKIIETYEFLMAEPKTSEQMMEERQAKIRKDDLLKSKFTSENICNILNGREPLLKEDRYMQAMLKAEMAATIVQDLVGVESVIASGIAVGLELATPPFGAYEKEQFKELFDVGDELNVGLILILRMLEGIDEERTNVITAGVIAILKDCEVLSEEEKAAKIAHKIFKGSSKLSEKEEYIHARLVALERVLEETRKNGTVSESEYLHEMLNIRHEQ